MRFKNCDAHRRAAKTGNQGPIRAEAEVAARSLLERKRRIPMAEAEKNSLKSASQVANELLAELAAQKEAESPQRAPLRLTVPACRNNQQA